MESAPGIGLLHSDSLALSFPVPSAGPKITAAYNTSSTSISVHWEPIPKERIHGILLGYKIFFTAIRFLQRIYLTTSNNATYVEATKLKKFSQYTIVISGYTRKGSGHPKFARSSTGEDGKCKIYIVIIKITISSIVIGLNNFECDWLIELSDNKLSNNKLSDNKLSDNNLASELVENRSFLNQSQSRKL